MDVVTASTQAVLKGSPKPPRSTAAFHLLAQADKPGGLDRRAPPVGPSSPLKEVQTRLTRPPRSTRRPEVGSGGHYLRERKEEGKGIFARAAP